MPLLLAAVLVTVLVGASPPSLAQPTATPSWSHDEHGRSARIVELDGRVHLRRDSGESLDLGDNLRERAVPVREGDRLHTGWSSRLVLAVGPNRLKLDERSTVWVRQLDQDGVALVLERGSVVMALRQGDTAWRWQVETVLGRHQPHGAGLFRVDAPDRRGAHQDAGSATAWRSPLRIDNDDGTLLLPPGRRAEQDRHGRWQIGFPQADGFSSWAMAGTDTDEPHDDRRPRQWQTTPSWEYPAPPPPRVIVVPPPIVIEPPPHRQWRAPAPPPPPQPEPRHRDPGDRWERGDRAVRDTPPPPRPDRRAHEPPEVRPAPAVPGASSPSEARRPQRAL
jgi:hypothetical protein